jgi:hypothetical protein
MFSRRSSWIYSELLNILILSKKKGKYPIEFMDNGMDDEKKKRMSLLIPDKNVYLKINALWPDMLFVTMAFFAG